MGKETRTFQEYVMKGLLLKKEKLPCLIKYQTKEKNLKLKVYTNTLYSSYATEGMKLVVRVSKPLNKFQFETSNPAFSISGQDVVWNVSLPYIDGSHQVRRTF